MRLCCILDPFLFDLWRAIGTRAQNQNVLFCFGVFVLFVFFYFSTRFSFPRHTNDGRSSFALARSFRRLFDCAFFNKKCVYLAAACASVFLYFSIFNFRLLYCFVLLFIIIYFVFQSMMGWPVIAPESFLKGTFYLFVCLCVYKKNSRMLHLCVCVCT